MLRGKTPHFRLACVAQKRRCLSSLLYNYTRKSDGKVKEEKRNKAMAAFFVFIIATLELVFGIKKKKKKGEKRMFDAKGPFGDKVFKNPARYVFLTFLYCPSQIMQ